MGFSRRASRITVLLSGGLIICNGFVMPQSQERKSFTSCSPSINKKSCLSVAASQHVYTDLSSLNSHLEKLASKCGDHHNPVVSLASEAEDLFSSAVKRNTKSFNTLLKAWSKVCNSMATHRSDIPQASIDNIPTVPVYKPRDAAEHMTKLLMEAEQDYERNPEETAVKPNRESYNLVIEGWAKSRADDSTDAVERLFRKVLENDRLEVDTTTYHGVLDAWAHSDDPQAHPRMLSIWNNMVESSKHSPVVNPCMRSVHFLMMSCARRAQRCSDNDAAMEAAREAHGLLKEQLNNKDPYIKPDVASYAIVMDAYANVGTFQGTQEAEQVMQDLKSAYDQTGDSRLRPNQVTYASLMKAWAHTPGRESVGHVQSLFDELENDSVLRPNIRTYSILLNAWVRSTRAEKAKKALKILMAMREKAKKGERDVRPSLSMYNCAIEACAKTPGDATNQTEALKIAFAVLKSIELEPDMEPNQITYATLMWAASKLMSQSKERNEIIVKVLDKAKAAGMVGSDVLRNFRKTVYSKVARKELDAMHDAKGFIDFKKVPKQWRRNLR